MHFVTGQMVGDRRFPGATILGGEFFHFSRQPSRFGPADRLRTSWCLLVWTVYEMAGPVRSDGFTFLFADYDFAASLWPAVAAAAKGPAESSSTCSEVSARTATVGLHREPGECTQYTSVRRATPVGD